MSDDGYDVQAEAPPVKARKKPSMATAASKKRSPAKKMVLTDMLKPAESSGTSPEKKVRKMRASPFKKKNSSLLKKSGNDVAVAGKEVWPSLSDDIKEVSEAAATGVRPQRANRKQTRYVVSDSNSEKATEDSDFDEIEDED